MTESIKATRASVQIGALEVDGFMLPDGSLQKQNPHLRAGPTQVSEVLIFRTVRAGGLGLCRRDFLFNSAEAGLYSPF